jgi:hypothetical protein
MDPMGNSKKTMRNKRGFIMPMALFSIAFFSLLIGALLANVTSGIEETHNMVSYRKQEEASRYGLKIAEDWLLSSIAEGSVPLAPHPWTGVDLLERIEAKHPGGKQLDPPDGGFENISIDLYIADTDYLSGIFSTSSSSTHRIPRIPQRPESWMPGDERLRCYFLRSSAEAAGREIKLACEEVLAVSIDHNGKIEDVTRLFYRSVSHFEEP